MLTMAGSDGDKNSAVPTLLAKYNILNYLPIIYFSHLYHTNKISKNEMLRILGIMCECDNNQNPRLVTALILTVSNATTTENINTISSSLKFEEVYHVYMIDGIIPFLVVEFGKWIIDDSYNIYSGILNIISEIEKRQYYE
jgi:hypothetical protein